jgi:hypothetical protein
MNIELRITDPGIPVTLHSCRHRTHIFCAKTLANFELEFFCLKQDRISMLEQKLERVDHEEISSLFLGKSRCDGNPERVSLLSEIETRLADYGKCL